MSNRNWSACLAIVALVWMPTDAAACAVAIGEEDDECAEYLWGYTEDGVLVSGERIGAEGEVTESSTIDVGVGGIGAEAGIEGTQTYTYPVATYQLSNGERVTLSCVTYEPVELD